MKYWPATVHLNGDADGLPRRRKALETLREAVITEGASSCPGRVDMLWLFSGADISAAMRCIASGTLIIAEAAAFSDAGQVAAFIKKCHGAKSIVWPVSPVWHRSAIRDSGKAFTGAQGPVMLEMHMENSPLIPRISDDGSRYGVLAELSLAAILALGGAKIEGRGCLELYRRGDEARIDATFHAGNRYVALHAEQSDTPETRHEVALKHPGGVVHTLRLDGSEAVMDTKGAISSVPGRESFEDIIDGVTRAWVGGEVYGDTLGLYRAHLLAEQLQDTLGKKMSAVTLVVLPRYRPEDDPVYLPSIPVARLTAFLRKQGAGVSVVDADIDTRNNPETYRIFEDHQRVQRFIEGGEDAAYRTVLEPVAEQILHTGGRLVGFSLVDDQWRFGADIAGCLSRILKERQPSIRTVTGGEMQVIDPVLLLREYPALDWVVRGDGEVPLLMLGAMLLRNDRAPWSIPGLYFRQKNEVRGNEDVLRLRLDHKPVPDFSPQPMERYRFTASPQLEAFLRRRGIDLPKDASALVLPYYYVRGCVHKCLFCGYSHFWDVQSYEKTIAELRQLSRRWNTRYFYFLNTTFNMTPRILRETLEAFGAAGLDILFWDSVRPQFFTPENARAASKAGLVLASIGLESGSDDILQRMKKGVTTAQAGPALDALNGAGIINRINMIPGFLHETQQDIDASVRFVQDHAAAFHVLGCFHGYRLDTPSIDEAGTGIRLRGETMDRLHDGEWSYVYDEVGGKTWEEKKEAIRDSWMQVRTALDRTGMHPYGNLDPGAVFIIYSLVPDRVKARELVLEYLHANPLGR